MENTSISRQPVEDDETCTPESKNDNENLKNEAPSAETENQTVISNESSDVKDLNEAKAEDSVSETKTENKS